MEEEGDHAKVGVFAHAKLRRDVVVVVFGRDGLVDWREVKKLQRALVDGGEVALEEP